MFSFGFVQDVSRCQPFEQWVCRPQASFESYHIVFIDRWSCRGRFGDLVKAPAGKRAMTWLFKNCFANHLMLCDNSRAFEINEHNLHNRLPKYTMICVLASARLNHSFLCLVKASITTRSQVQLKKTLIWPYVWLCLDRDAKWCSVQIERWDKRAKQLLHVSNYGRITTTGPSGGKVWL